MKTWKLGLCLLLLLLAISPVFSQDSSSQSINIALEDWQKIQQYYQTSQTELKILSSELSNLQNSLENSRKDLEDSLSLAETLRKSLLNMEQENKSLQSRLNIWKWIGGVSIGISIGGLAYILITSLQ